MHALQFFTTSYPRMWKIVLPHVGLPTPIIRRWALTHKQVILHAHYMCSICTSAKRKYEKRTMIFKSIYPITINLYSGHCKAEETQEVNQYMMPGDVISRHELWAGHESITKCYTLKRPRQTYHKFCPLWVG